MRHYQHLDYGKWFLCDCLESAVRPPALVPVMESFIRRHSSDPPWPQHAEGCDFHKTPAEQSAITRSFALPTAGPLRLIRGFTNDDKSTQPSPPRERCYAMRRDALATLLLSLIEKSRLNVIDGPIPDLGDQYRRLRAAASEFELDDNVGLQSFFCTYSPALPDLFKKLATTLPGRFRHARPHGLFLIVLQGLGAGQLFPVSGDPIPVRGRISIFGERDGHGPDRPAERAARAPYLALCLIGQASSGSPVEVLRAYAHPCVSLRHLMPVDSNLERDTLQELLRLKSWLQDKKQISLSIKKPNFDLDHEVAKDPEEAPRQPCIPDFILTAEGAPGTSKVLVETMGYADEVYRCRKHAIHHLMSALADAPVVQHDFHFPEAHTQHQRDRRFWLDARWLITGPDSSTATTHND